MAALLTLIPPTPPPPSERDGGVSEVGQEMGGWERALGGRTRREAKLVRMVSMI